MHTGTDACMSTRHHSSTQRADSVHLLSAQAHTHLHAHRTHTPNRSFTHHVSLFSRCEANSDWLCTFSSSHLPCCAACALARSKSPCVCVQRERERDLLCARACIRSACSLSLFAWLPELSHSHTHTHSLPGRAGLTVAQTGWTGLGLLPSCCLPCPRPQSS